MHVYTLAYTASKKRHGMATVQVVAAYHSALGDRVTIFVSQAPISIT